MPLASPHCPRCGYDLSGIVASWTESCPIEGACSECGLSFPWGEVFFPLRNAPAWSFEHAEHPAPALAWSWGRSLRPDRFWSRLRMHHAIVVPRLWVALAIMLLLMHLATGAGMAWLEHTAGRVAELSQGDWLRVRDPLSVLINPYARVFANQFPPVYTAWVYVGVLGALLCPAGFALLRQTSARLGLRREHALRGAAYSLAPLPPLLLVFAGARALRAYGSAWALGLTLRTTRSGPPDGLTRICNTLDDVASAIGRYQWAAIPLCLAWCGAYWWCFSKLYLQLPDATRTALLLVLTAFLAALAIVTFWPGSTLARDLGTAFLGMQE